MEQKARIVLSNEVHRTIKWFTFNFDKEIGAVGTGSIKTQDGDKYFYVDKIYFPKQEVSAASVHFTTEMWGDIIKKLHKDELGRICFYWHKHPGSAAHSSTDEEDTFETFMGKEANRKFFLFLQTAKTHDGKMDTEARIELRHPIRTTILKDNIELLHEISEEEEKLRKECEKIIKESIVIPKPAEVKQSDDGLAKQIINAWANKCKPKDYMSSNMEVEAGEFADEAVKIEFKDGAATVYCGLLFERIMDENLKKGEKLDTDVRQFTKDDVWIKGNKFKMYKMQPKTKCFKNMQADLMWLFKEHEKSIFEMSSGADAYYNDGFRRPTYTIEAPSVIDTATGTATDELEEDLVVNFTDDEKLSIKQRPYLMQDMLGYLVENGDISIEWVGDRYAEIFTSDYNKKIGTMVFDMDMGNGFFNGKEFIDILKQEYQK